MGPLALLKLLMCAVQHAEEWPWSLLLRSRCSELGFQGFVVDTVAAGKTSALQEAAKLSWS